METRHEILHNGITYAKVDAAANLAAAAAILFYYRPSHSSKSHDDEVAHNQGCMSVQTPGGRPQQAGHSAHDTHHSCKGRTYLFQPRAGQGHRRPQHPGEDGLRHGVPVGERVVYKDMKVHNVSLLRRISENNQFRGCFGQGNVLCGCK